jgi:small subunit ribosomal protein S1
LLARFTSRLSSAVLEAPVAATTASDEEPKRKVPQPTRFDSLKRHYKGPRPASILGNESELQDLISFTYSDFANAVVNTQYAFERNSIVPGVVVEHKPAGCLVDIGAKASAFLPEAEASLYVKPGVSLSELLPLDTELQFQIISEENEEGQLLVSIKRIQYKAAWERVQELAASDEVINAEVVAVNRGGAICLVEGLRAFLPGSHLSSQLPDEDLIGKTLPLKFLEVNTETNKLVVSNRKAVVEQQMSNLSRGDLVMGVIKALKPYGAFVDVGGMSGLLHISQISYDRIDDLEKVFQPGNVIKCMIIDHDKVNGRIALATKYLEFEVGAMLKDPQAVFDKAEETAKAYHEKMEAERLAREASTRDIVMGLGDSLDDLTTSSDDSTDAPELSDSLDALLS